MSLDPSFEGFAEVRDRANDHRCNNLYRSGTFSGMTRVKAIEDDLQDGVHLPNELHPDRQSSLCDRATELSSC